jgi:hypothetical protein
MSVTISRRGHLVFTDDFEISCVVEDEHGNPVDITHAEYTLAFRRTPTATPDLELSTEDDPSFITWVDPEEGVYVIAIPAATMALNLSPEVPYHVHGDFFIGTGKVRRHIDDLIRFIH